MAVTEIHYSERDEAFVIGWRQRQRPTLFLMDEAGRWALFETARERSTRATGFNAAIADLQRKFSRIDDIFRRMD